MQNAKEVRDELSISAGRHAVKVGGGVRSMLAQDDLPPAVGERTEFGRLRLRSSIERRRFARGFGAESSIPRGPA